MDRVFQLSTEPATYVTIVRASRLISPGGGGWDYWFERGAPVSEDFLDERNQLLVEDWGRS